MISKNLFFKMISDSTQNNKCEFDLKYDEIIFTHNNDDWISKHLNEKIIKKVFRFSHSTENTLGYISLDYFNILEKNYDKIENIIIDKNDKIFFQSLFRYSSIESEKGKYLFIAYNTDKKEVIERKKNKLNNILKKYNINEITISVLTYKYFLGNCSYIEYVSNNKLKIVLNNRYDYLKISHSKQVEKILIDKKFILFGTKKNNTYYKNSTLKKYIKKNLLLNKIEFSFYLSPIFSILIKDELIKLSKSGKAINYDNQNNSFYTETNKDLKDAKFAFYDVAEKENIDLDLPLFKFEIRLNRSNIRYCEKRYFNGKMIFTKYYNPTKLFTNKKFMNYIKKRIDKKFFNNFEKIWI